MEQTSIKQIYSNSLDDLLRLSRDTFFTAFAHLNDPVDMEAYAIKAFTKEQLLTELKNPDSEFYFAYVNEAIAGYMKLNYKSAQTEFQDINAMEVERIYVSAAYQNKRIGKQLLDFALSKALAQNLKYIWFGIWEQNTNAVRFYERNGFKIFGSHDFMLGKNKQTDLLMKKSLI